MRNHLLTLSLLLALTLTGIHLAASPSPAEVGQARPRTEGQAVQQPSRPSTGNPRHTPVVEVVRRVREGVVNIHSERTVQRPATEELFALAPSQNRINGMGTGIVLDP